MALKPIHNSFTLGEADPSLLARADLGLYQKTARKIRNLVPLWTGGVRIGPGLLTATESSAPFVLVDRTNANAPITDPNEFSKFTYTFDAVDSTIYTFVLRKDTTNGTAFEVFADNDWLVTVNNSISGTNVWTTAQIPDVRMAQREAEMIFTHPSRQSLVVRRGASGTVWTLAWWQPNYYPTFDFSTVDASTVNYRAPGFTFTPAATSGAGVNLTASSAVFNDNHVGGLFQAIGVNAGLGRIVSITSSTVAQIDIINNFTSAAAIKGANCSLREVMFSPSISNPPSVVVPGTDRGWPAVSAFYNDRYVVGKTDSLPNVVAFSESNSSTNFNDEDVDASRGFSTTITEGLQDIVADDTLLFLGVKKNYGLNTLLEDPLNPETFTAPPQGQDSTGRVRAVSVDNQVLHATVNGDRVNRITYATADGKYISTPATILSSHIVSEIISNAAWLPSNITAKLYLATQTDGSMLIYNTLISEGVSGWSLHTTRGLYYNVSGAQEVCDVLVKRQINTGVAVAGGVDYVFTASSLFNSFEDVTSAFNDAAEDVAFFESDEDYIVLGNDIPFTRIAWTLNTNASADTNITVEYLDVNNQWTTFTVTDGTTGFTGNGTMSWSFSDVANWGPMDVWETESKYWIRIRRNLVSLTTSPIEDQALINVAYRTFLEKLSFDDYTHGQLTKTSSGTGQVTGLSSIAGHQVYIVNGNLTEGPFFVDSTGVVELGATRADTEYKIGVAYEPLLRPMPLMIETPEGLNIYGERHISVLYVDYVDSLYLTINGEDIPMMNVNGYTLGAVVPPQTDYYRFPPRKGWDPRVNIDISQRKPGPMEIIGIGYEVKID